MSLIPYEYRKYIRHPRTIFGKLWQYCSPLVKDDRRYLSVLYRLRVGARLDLDKPERYTAKLQYLKLNDHRDIYHTLVDKYSVKEYVEAKLGPGYVIPTLGVWDSPGQIGWAALPDSFVLKCTHDCGSAILCRDKSRLDVREVSARLDKALSRDQFMPYREWAYLGVPRRIIAEPLVSEAGGGLKDYKFFCFNGVVKALYVAAGREKGDTRFDFFDRDFRHLDIVNEHPNAGTPARKPENYEKMVEIAETLSEGFPHVRIDLYNVDGKILFGEFTLYWGGGLNAFEPDEWDYVFGRWLEL